MAKVALVDLNTTEENAVKLATFLSEVASASDSAVAAAKKAAALGGNSQFVEYASVLIGSPELLFLAEKDSDVEGIVAWISSVVMKRVPEGADRDRLLVQLCEAVTGKPDRASLRLRVGISLFNMLPNPTVRYAAFVRLVTFGTETSSISSITSYLSSIDTHLNSWGEGISKSRQRDLYILAYNALLQEGEAQAAHGVLLKYLATFEGSDAAALSECREHAEAAITFAVQTSLASTRFKSDQVGILGYAAISQLKGEPLYRLLDIFVRGNVAELRVFFAEHGDLATARGLSLDRVVENTRLLCICSLASKGRELEYSRIAGALEISEDKVEEWVIKAVTAELIEAQIDQLRKVIVVDRATPSLLGDKHWEDLNDKLQAWRTNVRQLLGVIQDAKKQRSAMNKSRASASKVKA